MDLRKLPLLMTLFFFNSSAIAGNEEEQTSYTVLAGSSNYDCQFIGETTLAIPYQLNGNENAQLEISALIDKKSEKILKMHLKGNKSEKVITFDTGSCVNELEVAIK